MKEMNKKGFTLIELLAVIVILGILMMTAIPAVTKAIAKSRRNTYWQNMKSYAKAAATPFLDGEYGVEKSDGTVDTSESCPYPGVGEYVIIPITEIELEQGDNKKSSFKSEYYERSDETYGKCAPLIIVANVGTTTDGVSKDDLQWYVAGMDKAGNGINEFTNIDNLSLKSVKTGVTTPGQCNAIANSSTVLVTPSTNKGSLAVFADHGETGVQVSYKATCRKY